MGSIGKSVFGLTNYYYLELGSEEWGRELAIGSAWTKLRIGILAGIVPDGTNNLPHCHLRLGCSKAKDDFLGEEVPQLWYGVGWGDDTNDQLITGILTYNAGGSNPYFSAPHNRIRCLNGVTSTGTTAGSFILPTTDGLNFRRWPVVVELEKVTTSLVVTPWMFSTSQIGDVQRNFSNAELAAMVEGSGSPEIDGIPLTSMGSTTFIDYTTHAGVYGEIIAPHIGWKSGSRLSRVYQMAVAKLT